MKLWTIQPIEVFEKLKKEKEIFVDISKSENISDPEINNIFTGPYKWLSGRIQNKLSMDKPCYPWWAWYKYDDEYEPDFTNKRFLENEKGKVLLYLELNDEEVVLTDFDLWHLVLMNSYIGSATTDEEFELEDKYLESLNRDEREDVVIKSWDRIFHKDEIRNGTSTQANFIKLKLEYVKKYRYL